MKTKKIKWMLVAFILVIFQMSTVSANQELISTTVVGKGKPIILIHGMACAPEVWDEFVEKYKTKNNSTKDFLPEDEIKKAIKGILGMMRFGNYNSPILLNALGDVLLNETYSEPGAKRLSAMAYMASDLYNAGSVSLKTKENIQMFLSMQERDKNTYEELLKEVKKGILIGKSRYAEIEKKETINVENRIDHRTPIIILKRD